MKKFNEYVEQIYESAPRLPKSEEYWKKKGKSGKDVCLIFHDDLDGVVSAIIVKNYLENHGFKIKKYGIINYQEGWEAFKIEPELITISLDFAENSVPGCDVYIDHHGKFTEEEKNTQKSYAIKTETGSAAEGIARQLGVPFSKDVKDWIDMIDSAKYSEYDIDIKGILDFDLKLIKQSPAAKLKFAAAMNQLLKRSDHKTFTEVVNASEQPSIYNIYRLFKIFYPKNNPDWRTGVQPEFVEDARVRIGKMISKTRGSGQVFQGFDSEGKKVRFTSQQSFFNTFRVNVNGHNEVKAGVYQIIGNLMYVPSGTWANALRAKAIFVQDLEKGIVPDDPKLNFVLLQYGNTLQIADLRTKIKKMKDEDLPKDIKGNKIDNLGNYMEGLVKNFQIHLGYKDDRTVSGGHDGIGTISNIFGKCSVKPFEGIKYIDMFKNKIINDISGIRWNLNMIWNEEEDKKITLTADEINKKLVDISDIRSESDVKVEKEEREILNFVIKSNFRSKNLSFKDSSIQKIYKIWLNTDFSEIKNGDITIKDVEGLYFKKKPGVEDTILFNDIVNEFGLNRIYDVEKSIIRDNQRKELKRIFRTIFNMLGSKYINSDTEEKFKKLV